MIITRFLWIYVLCIYLVMYYVFSYFMYLCIFNIYPKNVQTSYHKYKYSKCYVYFIKLK